MKYMVNVGLFKFQFEDSTEAMEFAVKAKEHLCDDDSIISKDVRVTPETAGE